MTGPDDVRRVLSSHHPDCRIEVIAPLGAGTGNVAYEVNGDLVVRFAREPDPAAVEREARLLSTVAAGSPVPVPTPVFTAPAVGCLAYRRLPGVPLLDLPALISRPSIPAALGGFLAYLHAVPVDRVADLVPPDLTPAREWLAEAGRYFAETAGAIPAAHHDPIAAFLAEPPPAGRFDPVFSHHDLGIEHVLVDPVTAAVTGVIDWSDAALADPAHDLGLIHRDLGPAALEVALSHYPATPGVAARARFHARCRVFEDLAYGLDTSDARYVDKSLASLHWLFGP